MKKFSDLFNDFLAQSKQELSEELKQNIDLTLYNMWGRIIQKFPESQSKKILKSARIISFFNGELIIKDLNSPEKFILKTQEKKILKHMNEIVNTIQRNSTSHDYIKKIKFY